MIGFIFQCIVIIKYIDFYFIGPRGRSNIYTNNIDTDLYKTLKKLNNFIFLGSKDSLDLPKYINQFDLFLICYDSDKYTNEVANPHKLLEYLSTGKTIVSHYIDEYNGMKDLVQMANSNSELPELFSKIVNNIQFYNSHQLNNIRIKYAKTHTYSNNLKIIDSHINEIKQNSN